MAHCRFRRRIEQAVGNRIAGYRLQAEWGDERFCRLRHRDTHFRAAFTQPAHQFRGFIRRDAAADARDDFYPPESS